MISTPDRTLNDAQSQLALFATYSYHGFITDRDGEALELEADHAFVGRNIVRVVQIGTHFYRANMPSGGTSRT